jgi:hypothetical protein
MRNPPLPPQPYHATIIQKRSRNHGRKYYCTSREGTEVGGKMRENPPTFSYNYITVTKLLLKVTHGFRPHSAHRLFRLINDKMGRCAPHPARRCSFLTDVEKIPKNLFEKNPPKKVLQLLLVQQCN